MLIEGTLSLMRQLYYEIAAIKTKSTINCSNFEKLFNKSLVRALYMKNVDLTLVFQKAVNSEKTVDLPGFYWVIRRLMDTCVSRGYRPLGRGLQEFLTDLSAASLDKIDLEALRD